MGWEIRGGELRGHQHCPAVGNHGQRKASILREADCARCGLGDSHLPCPRPLSPRKAAQNPGLTLPCLSRCWSCGRDADDPGPWQPSLRLAERRPQRTLSSATAAQGRSLGAGEPNPAPGEVAGRERGPGPQLIWSPAPRATQLLGRRLRDHAGDLPYRGVVGEGALVLVDAVPGSGHANRGHVRYQQLAQVPCSHLPAAARHAEQGAPALHGRGAQRAWGGARRSGRAGPRLSGGAGWGSAPAGDRLQLGRLGPCPGGRAGAAIFNPMASRRPSCSVRRGARQPQSRGGGCLAGGNTGIGAGEIRGCPSTKPSPPWVPPPGCNPQLPRTRSGEAHTKSSAQRNLPHLSGGGGWDLSVASFMFFLAPHFLTCKAS